MNHKRIMWILTLGLVVITVAATLNTRISRSEETANPVPEPSPPDLSKIGKTDYDAPEPLDVTEKANRKRSNQRYDDQGWVQKHPHPETGMIGRHTESDSPTKIPANESDLIVTGTIVGVSAHLSNDKTGVYSEYKIRIDQTLKNNLGLNFSSGRIIQFDRAGGAVRYPHGQIVIYLDSDKGLPEMGLEYVLFLKSDKKSENYSVVTGYELQNAKTAPLDHGNSMDDIKRMGKIEFLKAIREKVGRSAQTVMGSEVKP